MDRYYTQDQALSILRTAIIEHGSQEAAAQAFGVSRVFLNRTLAGHAPLSDRLAKVIGMERVVAYRKTAGGSNNGKRESS